MHGAERVKTNASIIQKPVNLFVLYIISFKIVKVVYVVKVFALSISMLLFQ